MERVEPVDRAFLDLERERPAMRAVVGALYVLREQRTLDEVMPELGKYAQLIPRLRQRVVDFNLRGRAWQSLADFDIASRVEQVDLGPDATTAELMAACSDCYSSPWDPGQPLWNAWVITGLAGGRGALLLRFSHAISDGLGLVRAVRADEASNGRAGREQSRQEAVVGALRDAASAAGGHGAWLARTLAGVATDAELRADAARQLAAHARFLRAARPPRGGAPSTRRELGIVRAPVDAWKDSAARRGGGINDLFVACAATTMLRAYREAGVELPETTVIMPVTVRDEADADLGNKMTRVTFRLPPRDDLIEHLALVSESVERAQRAEDQATGPLVDRAYQMLPSRVRNAAAYRSLTAPDLAVSNLKYPLDELPFAGTVVDEHYAIGPSRGQPAFFALCTYAGVAHVAVTIDPGLVPDPRRIVELLDACVAEALA